jgi:FkbM family methyltransferase
MFEFMAQFSEQDRVALTTSCMDSSVIPKVKEAGKVSGNVQTMHNGIKVIRDGYQGAWMTEIISQLFGHHEPQEERAFYEILNRLKGTSSSPSMIELGSWWCYYTMWFLNDFPSGRAICIEPEEQNLELGRNNLQLNGLNAEFFRARIGSSDQLGNQISSVDLSAEVIQLNAVLERFSLTKLDILHCDIQGFELPMLESAIPLLTNGKIRFVIISTHHISISGDEFTHEKCLDLLIKSGAYIICEHNVSESFSGDGLIAASFDPADLDFTVPISKATPWNSMFSNHGRELLSEVHERRKEVIKLNEIANDLTQLVRLKDAALLELGRRKNN